MGNKVVMSGLKLKPVIESLRAKGMKWDEIAAQFEKEGYVTPKTGRPWARSSLGNILDPNHRSYGANPTTARAVRRKRRTKRMTLGHERSVNNLMRAVLEVQGVDRDTKLALIELVAQL